jgi:hypothetical protein
VIRGKERISYFFNGTLVRDAQQHDRGAMQSVLVTNMGVREQRRDIIRKARAPILDPLNEPWLKRMSVGCCKPTQTRSGQVIVLRQLLVIIAERNG